MPSMRHAGFVPALLLLPIGLAAARAQTVQPPVFRAGTDILLVDVSVVDGQGNPLSDLAAPEFTVKVDGEVRPILTAEYIAFVGPDASRSTDLTDLDDATQFSSNSGALGGRLIVIVIDQGNIRPGYGRAVAGEVGRLLDRLTASDRIALVTIPAPGPSVDFTTDHDRLQRELGNVTGRGTSMRGSYNVSESEALDFSSGLNPQIEESIITRECREYAVNTEAHAICASMLEIEIDGIAGEIRERSTRSITALRATVKALGRIAGPKTLIYISEGLVTQDRYEEISDIGLLAAEAQVTIDVVLLDVPRANLARRLPPTTAIRDRQLREEGLETIAGLARGALIRDIGAGGRAFARLARELSGYYLLGVEPAERDRDGQSHSIEVTVTRRDAIVRSRRQFRLATGEPANVSVEDRLIETLQAPLSAVDLPLRVASYAFQDTESPNVRVVVAAEMDRAGPIAGSETAPGAITFGYVLTGPEGKVVASEARQATGVPGEALAGLRYVTTLVLEPATYTLKLAAVDGDGRQGSVEHSVQAWKMADEPFAVGDLLLADAPVARSGRPPGVMARPVSGELAAYTELYSSDPSMLETVQVRIEIAKDENGPALAEGDALVKRDAEGRRATVQTILPVSQLPPGPYVARAIMSTGGETIGKLVRLFEVPHGLATAGPGRSEPTGATDELSSLVAATIGRLEGGALLGAEATSFLLEAASARESDGSTALPPLAEDARAGRFGEAARLALAAGDHVMASLLAGLERLALHDHTDAHTQFRVAQRLSPTFSPAVFYLGASHAIAGRDDDAARLWRDLSIAGSTSAGTVGLVADFWLRRGDGAAALAVLDAASESVPEPDALLRRRAMAYALADRPADALATFDEHLARHASDEDALLVAMRVLYQVHVAGGFVDSLDADGARAARYRQAYEAASGSRQALVAGWADVVTADGATRD